jgi:hypothetical protein
MNTEDLRAMMTNLRECSEGANDPFVPVDPKSLSLIEAQRAGITEPCGECGSPILVGGEGVCYQCQCELHSIGAIDMDNDPWRGCVDREPRESEGDSEYATDFQGPGPTSLPVHSFDGNGDIPF